MQRPAFDDAAIQRAAQLAIADNEGTIIAVNPSDGRIRAVVNPRLGFEQAFPPGSTLKAFTALAAMQSGVVDADARIHCGRQFSRGDYKVLCTHKRINSPFTMANALAYSCNYYFSTVAERMTSAGFFSLLDNFGFGTRTGVNATESTGKMSPGEWKLSTPIGNDEKLLTTPIQLLMAYTALVNGGILYRPRITADSAFSGEMVRRIQISPAIRQTIIEGMHGCVSIGSASDAGLNSFPYGVIGKTGTSGSSNGFRTQGWFVGFLVDRKNSKTIEPDAVKLAIVIFLKKSHGPVAAGIAHDFFASLLNKHEAEATTTAPAGDDRAEAQQIRVHLVRDDQTVTVGMERYVRGVLAAEASVEDQLEALKAQAIVSRTFALRNLGRHRSDGYDFCSLTHCQRFVNRIAEHNRVMVERAAADTAGRILGDDQRKPADIYFHASCGGMTTTLDSVWGVPSPGYLRARKDDYCTTMPHKEWASEIAISDLEKAIATEERSRSGHLRSLVISRRDVSGRAEFITIEGDKRRTLRGWDFALIVNRVLGWNRLKSSLFDVHRQGDRFLFRGRGFGHGLGFCQEGAHVMARRGAPAQQILDYYFPGANSMQVGAPPTASGPNLPVVRAGFSIPLLISLPTIVFGNGVDSRRRIMSSEHFRLSFPVNLPKSDIEGVLGALESARSEIIRRISPSAVAAVAASFITVQLHESTSSFSDATGQPWWAAGATNGSTIHLQPLEVLRKRRILASVLRHELAHVVIEMQGNRHAARWLVEGLAIHFAGEGAAYSGIRESMTREDLEESDFSPQTPADMKKLYAAAYREVRRMIAENGEAFAWRQATKP